MSLTVTKSELNVILANDPEITEYNLQKNEIRLIINVFLDTLRNQITSMKADEHLELRGLGSFCVKNLKPRAARNPKTGKKIDISSRNVVRFKLGKELKEFVKRNVI